jgi:hypothetical protein
LNLGNATIQSRTFGGRRADEIKINRLMATKNISAKRSKENH